MTGFLRKVKDNITINEAKDTAEAELLAERKRRILLVIKARWAIMGAYLAYGAVAASWLFYKFESFPLRSLIFYGGGLLCLISYNGFLHYSYERLSKLRGLAQLQMFFDILAATLIIHFTGGAASWFWSTYLLIVLQSAFLFDRKFQTLEIAALAGLSFSLLAILRHNGIIGNFSLSFLTEQQTGNTAYETLKILWVIFSSFAVAIIASYLLGMIRQRESYLAYKSITDGLTDLYNHSYFHKRLRSEIERAKRYDRVFSLALIDLDDFKQYNDTYGHQAGDELLRDVAIIFKESIRSFDVDTVYRYGGDEFAIMLPETGSQKLASKESGAFSIAQRIQEKIKKELPISISMGIASYPQHANDASRVFKAADIALYRAKEKGKNKVVVASRDLIIRKLKGLPLKTPANGKPS